MKRSGRYMDGESLRISKKMELKDINAVMAFSGWPDAKRVATYAAEYLCDKLRAKKIGEIDSRPFCDLSIQRPSVSIEKGLMKDFSNPMNELFGWKGKSADHDLLVLIGVEPNLNWSKYVELIFKVLKPEEVNRICLLGGLVDNIPHTIEPQISGVANKPELVKEMKIHDIKPADYSGPSSIHSLIINKCGKRNIPAISLWGHSPQYVGDVDPKTAYQLLNKSKEILGIEVDLEELRIEGNLFQKQLDLLMKQDSAFSELVHGLEIEYKNSKRNPDYLT